MYILVTKNNDNNDIASEKTVHRGLVILTLGMKTHKTVDMFVVH